VLCYDVKASIIKCFNEDGLKSREIASLLSLSDNTVKTVIRKYRENDHNIICRKRGGPSSLKLTTNILNKIETIVETNNSVSIKDIRRKIIEEDQVSLCTGTVSNALKKLIISTKNLNKVFDKVNNVVYLEKRREYADDFNNNAPADLEKCIYIDEGGFNLHLRRNRGRSKVGKRASVTIPTVKGRMITLILAMNIKGVLNYRIITDSTCNSVKFGEFLRETIEKVSLNVNLNGSWFILDNAQIHKTMQIRSLFDERDYTLKYLSPYSYMLNPAENVFSKIKTSVRAKLSENNENLVLSNIIKVAITEVTGTDCFNYVSHAEIFKTMSLKVN
jgi:transposase